VELPAVDGCELVVVEELVVAEVGWLEVLELLTSVDVESGNETFPAACPRYRYSGVPVVTREKPFPE
jgi:hypothetical protein